MVLKIFIIEFLDFIDTDYTNLKVSVNGIVFLI